MGPFSWCQIARASDAHGLVPACSRRFRRCKHLLRSKARCSCLAFWTLLRSPKPRRFRAVRQMSLVCDSSRALAHLVSHRCRALSEPRRANAFAAHEPGEARSHQGDGQWVVCDLLLEVFEKLAAGCVLCIIDELIDDLSGAHARSQFIESVG